MASQEKLRVMIVDDIAETRENIRRLLQFDTDLEVIATAKSGKEAIEICLEAKPDVVLMILICRIWMAFCNRRRTEKNCHMSRLSFLSVQRNPNICAGPCLPAP